MTELNLTAVAPAPQLVRMLTIDEREEVDYYLSVQARADAIRYDVRDRLSVNDMADAAIGLALARVIGDANATLPHRTYDDLFFEYLDRLVTKRGAR